ncbi:polysaccharide deacetylase family protein [Lichenihabitans sp. Uapishka_5]|uniref:polysaccharide deacetylase family protein n=1 Tax=Lichenihabitans sp. Uapishka_5 TaxID=3037302 RepID=UPI0029E7CFC5|nr:polysaccharide deacetylase family protein [Lichenihabitans sp. Uapishka_5]MDX7951993.1 polysaccharide deacetylase family protein [Lichenihabitans sp. Uapishka_5]
MAEIRQWLIGAGLATFRVTGLHRAMAPWTRGRGAILAFHHVRPATPAAFAPNRGLAITPAQLDAVLHRLRRDRIRLVPLNAVLPHLASGSRERVAALSFDDGYRDTLTEALPVLERHAAPFTTFVTTGFADRSARLWWLELEAAITVADSLRPGLDGAETAWPTNRLPDKRRAFAILARRLRAAPPAVVATTLERLGCSAAAGRALVDRLCLDWDGLARLAAHPLATIGCHTVTHPCLAALDPAALRRELETARTTLAERLGRPVEHLAYPYGGSAAAGEREFHLAAALGFTTAVTTRPGILRSRDAARPTALPRLSVNGVWPDPAVLDILLSGAPFALRDRVARRT